MENIFERTEMLLGHAEALEAELVDALYDAKQDGVKSKEYASLLSAFLRLCDAKEDIIGLSLILEKSGGGQ